MRATLRNVPLCLVLAVSGCTESYVLLVDLRTDMQPGVEFEDVVVELSSGDLPRGEIDPGAVRNRRATMPGDWTPPDATRAAELSGLSKGVYNVRVTLVAGDGTVVGAHRVIVHLTGNLAVTVLITRSCQDVTCPRDGDDEDATECIGNECVPPTCTPENPETCEEPCTSALDCEERALVLPCETAQCIEGVCWGMPTCTTDEYCHVGSRACQPAACRVDAGADAGAGETVSCGDAGEVCIDGECIGPCTGVADGTPCDDVGAVCMAERCVGPCTDQPDGTSCLGGAGTCSSGVCVGPCIGEPDGTRCGATTTGSWSTCGGYADACDRTGTRSRTVTEHLCQGEICTTQRRTERGDCSRAVQNGKRCGGKWLRCCGEVCRDLRTNRRCGACRVDCTQHGLRCTSSGTGGYSCSGCVSNAQCRDILSGSATCWNGRCNCQCGSNGVCTGAGCGGNFHCHDCPGQNYCAPFGGGC